MFRCFRPFLPASFLWCLSRFCALQSSFLTPHVKLAKSCFGWIYGNVKTLCVVTDLYFRLSRLNEFLSILRAIKFDIPTGYQLRIFSRVFHRRKLHFVLPTGVLAQGLFLSVSFTHRPKMRKQWSFYPSVRESGPGALLSRKWNRDWPIRKTFIWWIYLKFDTLIAFLI